MKKKKIAKKRVYANSEDTLLVISRYDQSRLFDGQKALKKLSKKQQIIVLAEENGRKKKDLKHRNLTIHRLWKRNKPFSFIKLVPFIVRHDKITHVLFQFDFKTLGRRLEINLIAPLILFYLKLSKKRVYFEFHHVLEGKKIRKNTPLKFKLYRGLFNFSLRLFYRSIYKLTNSIIVFKPSIKQALAKFIPEADIILLPSTLVRIDRIKTSRRQEKNLDKTINIYKSLVSTPYDISSSISLNVK